MLQFYVCKTPEEYAECSELQFRIEGQTSRLGWPTVYGRFSDGPIIGFTGTNSEHGCVISGPTVIDPQYKPRLAYARAQIGAHEHFLKELGITEYIFSVEKNNPRMLAAVFNAGMLPFSDEEERYWFKRQI